MKNLSKTISFRPTKEMEEKINDLVNKKGSKRGTVVRKLVKQILDLPIKPNFSKKTREENS